MIEAIDLCKHYRSFAAIDHLTFTIRRGEVVAFLGPNGAGKSTTMKVLTGYQAPTSGTARLCGIDVVTDRVRAVERLGYLPENGPLYPEMTPRELLTFFGEARGLGKARIAERLGFVTQGATCKNCSTNRSAHCSRAKAAHRKALLHDPEGADHGRADHRPRSQPGPPHARAGQEARRDAQILLSTHLFQGSRAMAGRSSARADRVHGTPAEFKARGAARWSRPSALPRPPRRGSPSNP
jgi:ABC-2 type transport system ATP-binding protein